MVQHRFLYIFYMKIEMPTYLMGEKYDIFQKKR